MSLKNFKERIHQFVERIKGSLDLEPDPDSCIARRRTLLTWIHEQTVRIRDQKEKQRKNQSIFSGILTRTGISQPNKKLVQSQTYLEMIKTIISTKQINFDPAELNSFDIPLGVSESLRRLNNVKIPEHYGVVSGPLMDSLYLRTRQDFDGCLRRGCVNDLRFTSLGSDFTHVVKYQRILIEQLFNRLFFRNGELSMVIKIEVEKESIDRSIEVFCLVQDLSHQQGRTFRSLKDLNIEESRQDLYLSEKKEKIYVEDMSVFHSILTQMLVIPFQTIVSDYVVELEDGAARLVKMHQAQGAADLSFYIKEHPSLRNPLFFFYNFIKSHQFSAQSLRQAMQNRQLYGNFYEILSLLVQCVKNDFSFRFGVGVKLSSLGIDQGLIRIIWQIFHELMVVPNWVEQVIAPIRPAVSLLQVIKKVHPIFGEMLKAQKENYEQHQKYLLALPIENYLALNVSKITIQKYKDIFLNNSTVPFLNFTKRHPFEAIFYSTLKNYNLTNAHIYEAIYFLNFIAKHNPAVFRQNAVLHPSWRNRKLWKQIISIRNKEFDSLPYLSIGLDILALYLQFDPVEESLYPFADIRHDEQNQDLFQRVQLLITILLVKYERKSAEYLSILIQKAFRYKKYRIVEFLIKKGVHINNYSEIFSSQFPKDAESHLKRPLSSKDSKLKRELEREKLKQLMKDREPQMYRRYQWEQLLGVYLRQHNQCEHLVVLQTIRRGRFYVDQDIYAHLTSGSSMNNTISRNDYMFSANRNIAKLNIVGAEAYIQLTQYPLLRYFYSSFLGKLDKGYLALNFCGFFSEHAKLGHLIECIPQCFNFQKGLASHTQTELKNYTNPDDIAEAILVSMMLMPTGVLLKNIIISPLTSGIEGDPKSLFIVDFYDFYQKNGFESYGGTTSLKVRNSLFLFDEMANTISERLMKKYAAMKVLQIVNGVFKQCAAFIREVNVLRPKDFKVAEDEQQLHTLIFQNGFAEVLTERMFKMKNALEKCLRNKSQIDPLELLQILNPPLSYYYREIIQTTPRLIERERIMLDDSFKKSLIINDRLINFLPNAYYVQQVRDNFPNHYKRFGFQGPTQNLAALDRKIFKFSVYTDKICELKDYDHETIEYFIRNVDLSLYLKEEKEALVTCMQDYSKQYLNNQKNCLPLSVVRINNIDSIKEKSLRFSDQRLQELIFQELRCSQGQFNALLRKYHSMRNLILRAVAGAERIGQSFVNLTDALSLRNLKYLSIISCPEIVAIDLRCQQLQHVTLRRNKSLSQIYLLSKRFKNMDCSECSRLRLENIGIYILKRINMLICQHSCDGDVKRLQDKNYSIFLTRILRYLLNRFQQSNVYKLQLILTLVKLDLVDGALFGFKGSLSNKNYLSIISKLGKEVFTVVQTQLFDLFLKNNLVELLNIDQLLKIQSSSLKAITEYLLKQLKLKEEGSLLFKKQFSGLRFKEFIKIPLFYSQHIQFVKLIVRYIDVDKAFSMHLCLSNDIPLSEFMELIAVVNRKQNLERLQIIIQNSIVTKDFLVFLYNLNNEKNKISRINFFNCDIRSDSELVLHELTFMRELSFNSCAINCLNFIQSFSHLTMLEIFDCKMAQSASQIYSAIGRLKMLKNLYLNRLKRNLPDQKLSLEQLLDILQTLPKLSQLDLSSNEFKKQELQFFSSKIHKIKIYQLTLHNFISNQVEEEYIDSFLYHDHIKILNIDFKHNGALFESFINELSRNKSIVRVNLKTENEVQSHLFQKMKENRVLESIHSNYPLPNWLKNHVISNSKAKSAIYEYDGFEQSLNSGGKSEDFYRIGLSLDGGGVRGLLLATQLHYLSTKIGKPLHKIFDCVGGTSIGGILALASTGTHDGHNPVCSTADLIDIFQVYGNRIFKKSQFGHLANLFQNKYDVKSFQDLLNGYFKMIKLSGVLTETNVVVTAVNRLTNQDVIFRSINAIFDRNQDFYMRDIARGTSAAPTYFPSAEIKNVNATQRYSLIDGGVGLNNPSKLVIDDIIKITQNEAHKKNYFLLSLGTGRLINQAIPSNAGIKDLAPIIDSFTESANFFIQKDLAQNYRGHFLRVSPLIDMHRKDGDLDNTSPQILKVYRDTGLLAAEQYFTNTIAFGKYKNKSLVEWLQENTDRKHEV